MIPLSFKPLSIDHLNLLHKWMQQPHVHQWWSDGKSWSFNDIREKYTPYTLGYKIEQGEKKLIFPFVIEFENRPVGFIQYYSAFDFKRDGFCVKEIWQNQNQSLAAIDFYIGEPDCIGKGLAPKALTSFLQQYVFNHFDACLVDPEKNNKAAIKAYAKAGFSTFRDLDSSIVMIAHREEIKNNLAFQSHM